ncbi:NAD-dependent epimerase/dehydratase family protein [Actinokineospora enzanensis]|uniref:NAD-dependent epimerase/dehydratase family protein n=1 Tax=Actinokineospora enzanensis TaxID=155975 RepID=UPI00036E6DC8|nr:NAD-dependent epimerase/dehydratase family protein [Actinokineospora enzanensis]
MRVLVTGGAGFIGRHVVEALVAQGHQVRVLDALLPAVHPSGQAPSLPDGVEFVVGDLRSPATVERALAGIDVVSHQAAMVGRGREIRDVVEYVGCNDLATATLLDAMVRRDLGRLVLASSVVIYGDSRYDCPAHGRVHPGRRSKADLDHGRFEPTCDLCGAPLTASPVEEDDLLDPPRNVYAVTKLSQEHLVGAWARETGAHAVALRYHNVYGPHMPHQSPYSGVAGVFRTAVADRVPARVYEDGQSIRDFIHVRDIAAANVAALTYDSPGLRTYNVATGTPHSILDVATAIATTAGTPLPIVTGEYRIGDVRHIVASPARIRRELDWHSTVSFETGMREFATATMRAAV